MAPENPVTVRPSLLHLPPEIRNRIYEQLLSVNVNKTPELSSEHGDPATRYRWNLHLAILRTSHRFHDEARAIMGKTNSFVVVDCAAKKLHQRHSYMWIDNVKTGQRTATL